VPLLRDLAAGGVSPYLRQHVDNPVDWWAWGDDAFARAADQDRPVFLSVGYSACHWCHVMAHESFEDPATAAQLNEAFVCVKVDREERPDVDAVYMEAVQAMTGSGGWPMSVFLTPDGRPFFGGTYFPPTERPGTPSFRTVLTALTDVWSNRRDEVETQADELARAIASRTTLARDPATPSLLDAVGVDGSRPDLIGTAVDDLRRRFDPTWGGFGRAPKFPQPVLVDLALRAALRGDGGALELATRTLDGMAAGGIHDHLGGGFARYSTDDEWLVPHFEKMLYDQAGLLRSFVHGWLVTGAPAYRSVVEGIVTYVTRDLRAPEGGLFSAEDADSEGVEGRFYVWTPDQVAEAVDGHVPGGPDEVMEFFGVRPGGNFEGASILRRPVGAPLTGSPDVEMARRRLLAVRGGRVRPGLDDKVLTEWNAMFVSALCEAAAATGEAAWGALAESVADFLWDHLRDADGVWFRSWQRDAGARHRAYAADHAWLVDAATRLGELTGRARWTDRAVEVADALLDGFADVEDGGFFTTAADAERLLVRTKDLFDGAVPSANGVAALALARLGALTGVERFTDAARGVVDLLGDSLPRHPVAFALAAQAADLLVRGTTEVVVPGDATTVGPLLAEVRARWLPGAVLAWGAPTGGPLWADRSPGRAYVCRGSVCALPTGDPAVLAAQLDGAER
jgi:uncharacterized protein YyaL (SSP411 family)